jgi:hypothetical protein
MSARAAPDRIDTAHAALIVYDACRRALMPADPARRAAIRPVVDAWVTLIGACRARAMPIIYTTPVSRADGADVVLLPTDLSVETGVPSLTNCIEGTPEADFSRRNRPRARGLRVSQAPSERVLRHRRGRAAAPAAPHRARDRRRRHQSRRRDERARGVQPTASTRR